MKFKPTDKAGGLVVELGPRETQLPPAVADEESRARPVFQLKKILVPLDFSDCSKKALQYAIPFAKQFGAQLILLHVVPPPLGGPEPVLADFETVDDGKQELEALLKIVCGAFPASALVRSGVAYVEIAEAAAEQEIDLIILSTHGRSGLNRVVLGSTAEKVVRSAPCPVLVVREHEHEFV